MDNEQVEDSRENSNQNRKVDVTKDRKEEDNCRANKIHSSGKNSVVSTTPTRKMSTSPCSTTESASAKSLYSYQMDKMNNCDYYMSAESKDKKITSQPSFLNEEDEIVYMSEMNGWNAGCNSSNEVTQTTLKNTFKKKKLQNKPENERVTSGNNKFEDKENNDMNNRQVSLERDKEELGKSPTPECPSRDYINNLEMYNYNNYNDNIDDSEQEGNGHENFHKKSNYNHYDILHANENSQSWQSFDEIREDKKGKLYKCNDDQDCINNTRKTKANKHNMSSMHQKNQSNGTRGKVLTDRIPTRGSPIVGNDDLEMQK